MGGRFPFGRKGAIFASNDARYAFQLSTEEAKHTAKGGKPELASTLPCGR